MNKKAQGWGIDLIAASTIFIFGVVLFYLYSINYSNETEDIFENMRYEGDIMLKTLLSSGFPQDWTTDNVTTIGIIEDGEIGELKLSQFYNMTQSSYSETKRIFNTQYDYYLSFNRNITIYSETLEGFGKPGTDLETLEPENLVKITRFSSYKNKPITIYLYLWED